MNLSITAYYAAILALLFVFLSVKTIKARRAYQVSIGDGGEKAILRASRVHANFAEYVPFNILLIGILEIQSYSSWVIHLLSVTLIVARISHAYGVSQLNENLKFRIFGTSTTLNIMATSALLILLKPLIFST